MAIVQPHKESFIKELEDYGFPPLRLVEQLEVSMTGESSTRWAMAGDVVNRNKGAAETSRLSQLCRIGRSEEGLHLRRAALLRGAAYGTGAREALRGQLG
jgi:hypothetical protein